MLAVAKGVSSVKSAIHTLQNPPPLLPRAPATAPKPPPPPPPQAPPFDIQDIPAAMRCIGMPMGAKLMERWFNGQLNYSPTDADEKAEINQYGVPYPTNMIDKTSITMKWVHRFTRAKNAFDTLAESRMLENTAARGELIRILTPYKNRLSLSTWQECKLDIQRFHKEFQFQFIDVNASWSERIAVQMIEEVANKGAPDDLTGALGSFNFFAAIAEATFNHRAGTTTVTKVGVYVKDHYTFVTKQGKVSQYLGHWNKSHVAILHSHAAAMGMNLQLSNTPVEIDKDIYYPVRNSAFPAWQQKHGQGGDFILYSDIVWVTLYHPITIKL